MWKYVWQGLSQAMGVVVYTLLVAWVLQHGEQWFGSEDRLLVPVAMLLLFVLSAAVVGSLVIGRSTMLYLSGQKKEGVTLFGWTVGWLLVGIIAVFLILL